MNRSLVIAALGAAGFAIAKKAGVSHPFLIAPLALFLVACAGDEDPCNQNGVITMTYPPSQFTPEELAVFPIVEADWNSFAGKRVLSLTPREGTGQCTITKNPAFGVGKAHLGRTNKAEGIIELGTPYDCQKASLQGIQCFQAILAHELGHMLGLHHVPNINALMFPQAEVTGPNEFDRPQCKELGVCP